MNPYFQVNQDQTEGNIYPDIDIDDDAKFQEYKHRNGLTVIGEPQFINENNYFVPI